MISNLIPLNVWLSRSGVCSRRKAVELIKKGHIKVNGQSVTDPAFRVHSQDMVVYNGTRLTIEEPVYILYNKPAGCITAVSDKIRGRKTVLDVIDYPGDERIFPIGRLDRATTGLLLLTNDGNFAQKLMHPKFGVKKTYKVTLEEPFSGFDMQKLRAGFRLEDGFIKPDGARYSGTKKLCVTVVLHSGKYRIVRRMFKHLGYKVKHLERIGYAMLDLKGVELGAWRYLTSDEVLELRNLSLQKVKRTTA